MQKRLFFFLILFISIIPLRSSVFAANDLGAYYVQDSKYEVCSTKQEYEKWENDLIAKIRQSGIKKNLFTIGSGSGPDRSYWNPFSTLYAIATFDDKEPSSNSNKYTVEVSLNDKIQKIKINWKPPASNTHIFSFTLPQILWEKHLRKIKPKDYPHIYLLPTQEELIDAHKNRPNDIIKDLANIEYIVSPGPGAEEVLDIKVNIYFKGKPITKLYKLFFVAYGE